MRYSQALIVVVLLLGLVGCQGPLNSPTLSAPAAAPQALASSVAPEADDCGGSGRVEVRPCPVTLTKKKAAADVRVKGPNVVDSAQNTNSRNHSRCGRVCGVGEFGSNPLEYTVSAGSKCGSALISFTGYDGSGNTVGIGRLKVINKDC